MAGKLFGTDGVRGVAGEFLTAELALALGQAATRRTEAERPQVLIIRDTRESGAMLQAALAAGVCRDRKSTRLNSSHGYISYAVFCLKKKKKKNTIKP